MAVPEILPPDGTVQEVMAYTRLSRRQVYRVCRSNDLESYLIGPSSRRITWASVERYRGKRRAAGSQLEPIQRPVTGKRRVGKPWHAD